MQESFTAGALRALERAEARARRRGAAAIEPVDLLAALAEESESRAGMLLSAAGLDLAALDSGIDLGEDGPQTALPPAPEYRAALTHARVRARTVDRNRPVATEHLLAGVLTVPGPAADVLSASGFAIAPFLARLDESAAEETAALPLPGDFAPLELTDPGREDDLGRILDAAANRAREGLRVVEDYARFVLDDPGLTRRLKEVRHRLAEALRGFDADLLIASRDTTGDVGTHIMTASEQARENPRAVLAANFKRTAEALRTLEEYGKLFDVWLAGRFEVLRYDVYTLEKLLMAALVSFRTLGDVKLMVLVGGLPTLGDLTWVVREALAGGTDAIQLREKSLPDRELLRRAREVRILTAKARARFFLNDRPDLARLAGADGVHLGQDDLSVRDSRRIAGPTALIGVSTHDRAQIDQAILDGANYLGVGPVFTSPTKDFSDLAGLAHVQVAAERTNLPWFAIGGITLENLDDVLAAGATRVAVSAAVVHAEGPRQAAAEFKARLE